MSKQQQDIAKERKTKNQKSERWRFDLHQADVAVCFEHCSNRKQLVTNRAKHASYM